MENFYLWEVIYEYFFYNAMPFLTALTGVLCSLKVLTCLHNHGTIIIIIIMHIHYVFIAKRGKRICQYCETDTSAFLYFKCLFGNIVYKAFLHVDSEVIQLFSVLNDTIYLFAKRVPVLYNNIK